MTTNSDDIEQHPVFKSKVVVVDYNALNPFTGEHAVVFADLTNPQQLFFCILQDFKKNYD